MAFCPLRRIGKSPIRPAADAEEGWPRLGNINQALLVGIFVANRAKMI